MNTKQTKIRIEEIFKENHRLISIKELYLFIPESDAKTIRAGVAELRKEGILRNERDSENNKMLRYVSDYEDLFLGNVNIITMLPPNNTYRQNESRKYDGAYGRLNGVN